MTSYREKYPLDWKVSDHVKAAGYLIEWLKAQGNQDHYDMTHLLSKFVEQFTHREWSIPELGKLRREKVYYRQLSDKTKSYVNSMPWMARTNLWDPIKKVVTGFRFKLSQKLMDFIGGDLHDATLINAIYMVSAKDFVNMSLDL